MATRCRRPNVDAKQPRSRGVLRRACSAAVVSLALVSGYLFAAVGKRSAQLAVVAQFAYMILFSYSFSFEGLTALTIAIGAIVTLALLMQTTAKVNWADKFVSKPAPLGFPPPVPREIVKQLETAVPRAVERMSDRTNHWAPA